MSTKRMRPPCHQSSGQLADKEGYLLFAERRTKCVHIAVTRLSKKLDASNLRDPMLVHACASHVSMEPWLSHTQAPVESCSKQCGLTCGKCRQNGPLIQTQNKTKTKQE